MNFDPREEKLPKWAQDLLHKERLKNALKFPDYQPKPDFVIDANGRGVDGRDLSEAEGEYVYSENEVGIFREFVGRNGYLYHGSEQRGSGARGSGAYYLSLQDARTARAWRIAENAANELLRCATMEPRR